jgi:hypothetical protein
MKPSGNSSPCTRLLVRRTCISAIVIVGKSLQLSLKDFEIIVSGTLEFLNCENPPSFSNAFPYLRPECGILILNLSLK